MKIIAIDPAERCGFACTSGARGFWDFTKVRQMRRFRANLHALAKLHGCDLLAAEDASRGSNNMLTATKHGEYRGILRLVADELGVELVLINPTSLKAWAAHNGHATKSDMRRWCKIHYGVNIPDDNECDAFLVLKYVEAGQHKVAAEAKAKHPPNRRWGRRKPKPRKLF